MQELLTFHRRFLRGSVLAIFLAFSVVFIVLFVFVLCLVYTIVASVSGLSISDCPLSFLLHLFMERYPLKILKFHVA